MLDLLPKTFPSLFVLYCIDRDSPLWFLIHLSTRRKNDNALFKKTKELNNTQEVTSEISYASYVSHASRVSPSFPSLSSSPSLNQELNLTKALLES